MLRFTAYAWAKLVNLRDQGPTEVGGFGLTETDDPALVTDFALVKQTATSVSVRFEYPHLVDFLTAQADRGLSAAQCQRVWIHTHPGSSASPSSIDEENFGTIFEAPSWAVMVILAREGESYARIRFNVGPGGELEIPVGIDWSVPFPAADHTGWKAEYERCVEATEYDTVWSDFRPKSASAHARKNAQPHLPAGPASFSAYDEPDWWWDDDHLFRTGGHEPELKAAAGRLGLSTDDLERMGAHTAEDLAGLME